MMTHPDFVLQATRDRQERISADVHTLNAHEAPVAPGKVRRTVGNALIGLGERVGGRRTDAAWTAAPRTRAHLV